MKLMVMMGGLAVAGVITAGSAQANMCGPGNGPLGYLWPNVQVCQLYTPGAGALARVPVLKPSQSVPYPQNNYAVPGWPIQLNPEIPGGPYSPGG